MTKLAVAIMVHSADQALAQAAQAAERGADLVELRIDSFAERAAEDAGAVGELVSVIEHCPLPCILTCRPAWEGGDYGGDEQTRAQLIERLFLADRDDGGQGGPDAAGAAGLARTPAYLDLELAAYQDPYSPMRQAVERVVDHPGQVRPKAVGLILSSHNFDRRPADLLQRVEAMLNASACRVIKLAWAARSLRDNIEAFELLRASHKPTIALCMGPFGLPARVLAKKFGALLTFAGLDEESVTAPGQAGVATMKDLYRWDAIDAQTQVYGVIGYPVEHSMSPAIHNAGFTEVEHNGVYLPMPIPAEWEHFKATVGEWVATDWLDFRGASVTIPHKEHLLRFVREQGGEVEPLAEKIGAANTLTRRDDGSLTATNTDYAAALDAVCNAMGIGREALAGRRIAVIGAGGAARAVVAGFAAYGATVVVYNRTQEKAQVLADAFDGQTGKVVAAPLAKLCDSCCEIYINCTPIGMHPNVDASPLEQWPERAGEGTVVFDTIYNPLETRLLREAKAAGCVTVGGLEMFVRQAAAQFEQWTGQTAPIETFRRIMRERLGG